MKRLEKLYVALMDGEDDSLRGLRIGPARVQLNVRKRKC